MKKRVFLRNLSFLWLIFALAISGSVMATQTQAANGGTLDLFRDTTGAASLDASDDPTIISERLVEINFDLLQVAADGKQAINLNLSEGLSIPTIPDQVKSNDLGQLLWTGHVEDEALSEVILVAKDGVLVGNIRWSDAYFQVRYLGDGVHAVREIDPSAFMEESDPIPGDAEIASSISNDEIASDAAENDETGALSSDDTAADSGARIDVLVVYTGAARAGAGGTTAMNNLITLAETETNTGYARSGVIQRVRVVHRAEVFYSEAGFNASTTLGRLRGTTDGYMDNVHALRNTYCADAVQLVANSSAFAGIGYVMQTVSNAFNTLAFSVVRRTVLAGNYTFAHELGHNMGAAHDRANAGIKGAYSYSYGYQHRSPLPAWRTIMAYPCPGGCTRLNNWSTPARTYNGYPMGVYYTASNSADNVRTLNNTRYTFANFRQECAQGGCSSVVTSLWPVNGGTVRPGEKARLWAQVRNTGSSALPGGARVGYWVGGPSGPNNIVGYTSVAGLAPGATDWRLLEWTVPGSHQPGSYSYWARVYDGSATCSAWRGPQNFTISAPQASAVVTSLYPVNGGTVRPGEKARLWAQVRNTGSSWLPATAKVAYWVGGSSGPNNIVGYTSVSGLAPGATSWRLFEWTVPGSHQPGSYSYWARVENPLSAWRGPQNFTIPTPQASAVVTSLWQVGTIDCGDRANLWALVRNTGSSPLPGAARVYYWVSGPSGPNNFVGYISVAGLAPGASSWRLLQWTVPTNFQSGTYSYWARVYNGSAPISAWRGPQNFGVRCFGCRSFSEQFSGGTAPMWKRDRGSWNVVGNVYYYTPGLSGLSSTSTYNQDCRNFDYRARLWRSGSYTSAANRLVVRASGGLLSSGHYRNEYIFQYSTAGTYSVWKMVNGVSIAVRSWTASSAIRKGAAWNELRVYASGTRFYFYINNTLVWTGTDGSLSSGREGVGMYRASGSTGNAFYVDWATLTALASDADVPNESVSDEQQVLNDLADKNPIGNVDSAE